MPILERIQRGTALARDNYNELQTHVFQNPINSVISTIALKIIGYLAMTTKFFSCSLTPFGIPIFAFSLILDIAMISHGRTFTREFATHIAGLSVDGLAHLGNEALNLIRTIFRDLIAQIFPFFAVAPLPAH